MSKCAYSQAMPKRNRTRQTRKGMPPEAVESVAARFQLLSSPSRLRILDALMEGPLGLSELLERTGLEQSNLSRHVAALERGGCVTRTREGQSVMVAIADPSLGKLCDLVCGSLRDQAAEVHATFRRV